MKKGLTEKHVKSLLGECIDALASEIDTVRKRPSEDVLYGGVKVAGAGEHVRYRFASTNPSLKYAEAVNATPGGAICKGVMLEFDEKQVILGFEKDLGQELRELHITWENDFVLRRIQEKLIRIMDGDTVGFLPILNLLSPGAGSGKIVKSTKGSPSSSQAPPSSSPLPSPSSSPSSLTSSSTSLLTSSSSPLTPPPHPLSTSTSTITSTTVHAPGLNTTQMQAVQMAVTRPATFIWGPPGTGKTATLGYIMANLLLRGQRVLFVSNTNRAVDVGMLSLLDALKNLERSDLASHVTRFGEMVLENRELEPVFFDRRLEAVQQVEQTRKVKSQTLTDEYQRLISEAEDLLADGEAVPRLIQVRIKDLKKKIKAEGSVSEGEREGGRSRELTMLSLLHSMRLIGTTLARVCTSELIDQQGFDAVVIDEASMAGIPYTMVMASKARSHLVVTGDPMQLPPISLTDNIPHKELLEQDIFTRISEAKIPEDLFSWHDRNPDFTCFFDTQYRLNSDLAGIISDVFYEGRLKTGKTETKTRKNKKTSSIRIINTEHQNPFITSQGEKGFRPVNELHLQIVVDEVHRQIVQEGVKPDEIGVIVPFRSSVWDYRKSLNMRNLNDVEVGTIHTFQGREKDVIIFDTVMSGQSQFGRMRHYSVRPFDEAKNGMSVPRLLNVAFSRCRDKLVLVADLAHMRKVYRNKFLGRLIGRLVQERDG